MDLIKLDAYAAKNGTKVAAGAKDPLGEVWEKVAEWKADYLSRKNATVAKLVAAKAKATPTPTPTSAGDADDAMDVAVPAAVAPPASVGNAYAVRFVKADLPTAVKAELAADATAKGMMVIEGDK